MSLSMPSMKVSSNTKYNTVFLSVPSMKVSSHPRYNTMSPTSIFNEG